MQFAAVFDRDGGEVRKKAHVFAFVIKAQQHGGISVFAGVGERTREGNDLWNEMRESGVSDKTALVFGQMNESPGVLEKLGNCGHLINEMTIVE